MKKLAGYALALLLLLAFCGSEVNSPSATPSLPSSTSASTLASTLPSSLPSKSTIPNTASETPRSSGSQPSQTIAASSDVLTQLRGLLIKGRAPKTGYDRNLYGSAWADVNRNGCDTRNDILRRDLTNVIFRDGTGNCVVQSGLFYDPYTNTQFEFIKSTGGSTIEIDHIVSLSDSWQKGAQQWDSQTRKEFANDPLNLVATSRSVNRSKSDSDAASWLPPNKNIRCAFISRQVAVKSAYQLWVTQAEFEAMEKILSSCPNQLVATAGTLRP